MRRRENTKYGDGNRKQKETTDRKLKRKEKVGKSQVTIDVAAKQITGKGPERNYKHMHSNTKE